MSDENGSSKKGTSGRKRNWSHPRWKQKSAKKWPLGGPAVMLRCESGREKKCAVEGLQLLDFYREASGKDTIDTTTATDKAAHDKSNENLSLEEELALLKQPGSNSSSQENDSSHFAVQETGCKGTVCLLYTADIAATTDESSGPEGGTGKDTPAAEDDNAKASEDEEDDNQLESPSKKAKTNAAITHLSDPVVVSSFNPMTTIASIFSDIERGCKDAPSSRFVLRMIPIQATCNASEGAIAATCKALVDKYLPSDLTSFAVAAKRRLNSTVKTQTIIDTVAKVVLDKVPNCKVQLKHPHVTVLVEVCKNLCGISIVENIQDMKNFNLFSAREGDDKTTAATPSASH